MDTLNNTVVQDGSYGNVTGMGPPPEVAMWGWWIKQIFTPIIAVVGILGNTMSFVVMKSKALRRKSYSHYLCSLALFDSLTLIGRELLLINELNVHLGRPTIFHDFSDGACKLYEFCTHVCYLMSSWLIVAMAFERIIAVFFPFKKSSICNQKVGVALIVSMVLVLSCTQMFRPVMMESSAGACYAGEGYNLLYIQLHTYFYQITLIFILPTFLVLMCNGLILYKIHEIRKGTRDYSSTTTTTTTTRLTHASAPRHKTTFMLLVISFTHVILILPLIILTLAILIIAKRERMAAARFLVDIKPYGDVLEVVSEVNYGINFFIYVISGKSFRRELRKLFTTEKRHVFSSVRTRDTNSR